MNITKRVILNYSLLRSVLILINITVLLLASYGQARSSYHRKSSNDKLLNILLENWSVQVDIGPGLYYGDLNVQQGDLLTKILNESRLSGQLVLANKVNTWLALQGRVIYGSFYAENEQINRYVDGSSILIGGNVMIDFINLFSLPNEVYPDIYLYGIIGGGLVNIRSKLLNRETGEPVLTYHWNREAINESAIYGGVGFNKYLGPNWDFVFEVTLYHIRSDRFDGLQAGVDDDYFVLPAFGLKYNLSRSLLTPKRQQYQKRKPLRR